TDETVRRLFCFRGELQDTGHALADVASQRLICTCVLVFQYPRRVFVLKNSAFCDGLHTTVAGGRRARARPQLFGCERFGTLTVAGSREEDAKREGNNALSVELHRGEQRNWSHERVTACFPFIFAGTKSQRPRNAMCTNERINKTRRFTVPRTLISMQV